MSGNLVANSLRVSSCSVFCNPSRSSYSGQDIGCRFSNQCDLTVDKIHLKLARLNIPYDSLDVIALDDLHVLALLNQPGCATTAELNHVVALLEIHDRHVALATIDRDKSVLVAKLRPYGSKIPNK